MPKIVHKLVAKTAKEITAAAWEILSSDNEFHKAWPRVGPFVRAQWRNFVGHARAALAVILQTPMSDPKVERMMKDPIYEAFLAEGGFKATPEVTSDYVGDWTRAQKAAMAERAGKALQ